MSATQAKLSALADVKEQLCAKYERLAKSASSEPKRKSFTYRCERYRRQARQMRSLLK